MGSSATTKAVRDCGIAQRCRLDGPASSRSQSTRMTPAQVVVATHRCRRRRCRCRYEGSLRGAARSRWCTSVGASRDTRTRVRLTAGSRSPCAASCRHRPRHRRRRCRRHRLNVLPPPPPPPPRWRRRAAGARATAVVAASGASVRSLKPLRSASCAPQPTTYVDDDAVAEVAPPAAFMQLAAALAAAAAVAVATLRWPQAAARARTRETSSRHGGRLGGINSLHAATPREKCCDARVLRRRGGCDAASVVRE